MSHEDYNARLKAWEKARFAPPPELPLNPIEPSKVERVSMRDGVRLYTEVFLPSQVASTSNNLAKDKETTWPVVFSRSPYPFSLASRNARVSIERYWAAGYAVVFQLCRGQGPSEGTYRMYRDDIDDGYDAIQWLAEQPWCNGRVGMEGSSYKGGTQLMAAKAKPPALKCIMPTAFVGSSTRYFPFAHGVPHRGYYLQWHQVLDAKRWDAMDCTYGDMSALQHAKWGPAFRHRPLMDAANEVLKGDKLASWQETISHPLDDDYWAPIHFTDKDLAQLDLPIFFTDGWYDMTLGPIEFFKRLETISPDRDDRYLLVGPWNHYQTYRDSEPGDNDGDRTLPDNGSLDLIAQRIAFFDRYLKQEFKQETSGQIQNDRVQIYITGSKHSDANQWFHFPTYPIPGTTLKKLYLHSQGDARSFPGDGELSWKAPAEEPTDHYTYNPALPTGFVTQSYGDRRDTEIRSDVLTYTLDAVEQALTIVGDIKLVLHAASDAPDTDWFAVLTEVFPDGRSQSFHYATPAFRARYREGFDREVFLTANQPEQFNIPMGPAGHQIAKGNGLRLSIFSSAFPEYDPNTNTGNEVINDTEMQIAQQTIYHDRQRPSHIILPIISINESQKTVDESSQ
ncbi:CocE/NonD family hydrolase [Porticoccaceae bacterium]|nr:CocE/NonD family hydrolase [Porticoccaceae bacterium]